MIGKGCHLLAASLVCAMGGVASAQSNEAASFPVERLRPSLDKEGIIDVESANIGPHLTQDAALWLGYAYNPLVLYRDQAGTPVRAASLVKHRLGADLVGSIALFDWVQVGVDVPVTLYQGRGAGLSQAGAAVDALSAAGLGDVRVVTKVRLLQALRYGVDLAVAPTITVPSGLPKNSYFGEKSLTFAPELLVGRSIGNLRLGANFGYRMRGDTRFLDLDVGSELLFRAGAGYLIAAEGANPIEILASLSGATAAHAPFRHFNQNPLELLAGASYQVNHLLHAFGGLGFGLVAGYGTPDVRVFAGVRYAPRQADRDGDRIADAVDACPDKAEDHDGFEDTDGCPDLDNDKDGIPDSKDGCPDEPEDKDHFEDEDGCPDLDNDKDGIADAQDKCPNVAEDKDGFEDEDGCVDSDNDKDGLVDAHDQCPNAAEDKDGFEDDDGCPDVDNDKDGVDDVDDKCPLEPEVINGIDDEDGCPDEGKPQVQVTLTKLEINEAVYFDTGKATIQKRSHSLLNQVAQNLKANPQITKVRIEGHTDDKGDDASNLKLSQDRADSVRRYLIKRKIDPARLMAVGYGETKPIASNKTARGRERNRRVEFTIIEVDGKPLTDSPSQ